MLRCRMFAVNRTMGGEGIATWIASCYVRPVSQKIVFAGRNGWTALDKVVVRELLEEDGRKSEVGSGK